MAPVAQLAGRFELGAKIGGGSFGQVFMGTDVQTGGEVAIKLEPLKSTHKCLAREADAYALLKRGTHFPALRWFGVAGECSVLVCDLLGPSLQDLFEFCSCRFSLKTVLSLADQMLTCIEQVHAVGLVHRDLKPDNFCIGLGVKASRVHLIDFGLAGCWQNPQTGQHVAFKERRRGLTGTARFASLHAHAGLQQSRRDDLESLGYIMLYFLRGNLPWQRRQGEPSTSPHILSVKLSTSVEDLCEHQPRELVDYVRHCRSLGFAAYPDYRCLRRTLQDVFIREGYKNDDLFDWTLLTTGISSSRESSGHAAAGEKQQANTTMPLDSEKVTVDDAEAGPSP